MKVKIEINIDNDAFQDDKWNEVVRILDYLTYNLHARGSKLTLGDRQSLHDINGALVGEYKVMKGTWK